MTKPKHLEGAYSSSKLCISLCVCVLEHGCSQDFGKGGSLLRHMTRVTLCFPLLWQQETTIHKPEVQLHAHQDPHDILTRLCHR